MRKQAYLIVIVISLFCFYQQSLISEAVNEPPETNYKISITHWITTGNFKMYGGPPNALNTWKLAHPLDSNLTRVLLTYTPPEEDSPYRIHVSMGGGYINEGTIRDTDWNANGIINDLSYSTSNGDVTNSSLAVDYRVTEPKNDYDVYVTFGYNYLKISSNYKDGHIVISDMLPVDIYAWQDRKWQIYDLVYQGIETGVKVKYGLTKDLSLETAAGFSPFVRAQYRGIRYPNTIFHQHEHILGKGNAFNGEVSVSYNVFRQFTVDGGFRYQTYRTKGTDQPGTPWAGSWDELTSDFKGFFFGGGWKF